MAQLLASPDLPEDIRTFLAPMHPDTRLGEVADKLEDCRNETTGQRWVELACLGLFLATPLAFTGQPYEHWLQGAWLILGLAHLPGIFQEQRQNWHCRFAAGDVRPRLQEAANHIGPPWLESLPDGERLDRRYQVSSRLPRREVVIDRWGQPRRHRWEKQVAETTLRFEADPTEIRISGPQGQECRLLHNGIHHEESWIMISLKEINLKIQLDGSLSLVWWKLPDPVCPRNSPGSDDSISLPQGVWTRHYAGSSSTRLPDRVEGNSFFYDQERIDSPLPLAWLSQ